MGSERSIVVVEDDHHISDLVAMYLRRDGFRVVQADDGEAGLAAVAREQPALVVVDIGLPGDLDGFDVCRRIRESATTPVLVLSARDDELDRILGLELGADDYVTKPFSPRELVARVRAILRRSGQSTPSEEAVLRIGELEVDTARHEVRCRDEAVACTTREFDLLAFLLAHPGLVLSRRQLLDGAWGDNWIGDERTVDVHVRQLRRKLGDDLPLTTVRGAGYRLA